MYLASYQWRMCSTHLILCSIHNSSAIPSIDRTQTDHTYARMQQNRQKESFEKQVIIFHPLALYVFQWIHVFRFHVYTIYCMCIASFGAWIPLLSSSATFLPFFGLFVTLLADIWNLTFNGRSINTKNNFSFALVYYWSKSHHFVRCGAAYSGLLKN